MADNVQVYTEGGMPSNRQVCGVRNTRIYGVTAQPLVAADDYLLFDLSADEVILGLGIEVMTASASAGTAVVSHRVDKDAAVGATIVTAADTTVVGKTAAILTTLPKNGVGDSGVLSVKIAQTDADVNVYAIVANVAALETPTALDTLAP